MYTKLRLDGRAAAEALGEATRSLQTDDREPRCPDGGDSCW